MGLGLEDESVVLELSVKNIAGDTCGIFNAACGILCVA